jgi:hypothetical protein
VALPDKYRRPLGRLTRLMRFGFLACCRRVVRRGHLGGSSVYTRIVYTEVVLDKIEGFDWDNANIAHIMRYTVTPFEVEEITGGKYVVIAAKTVERERRWKLFGKTVSGR